MPPAIRRELEERLERNARANRAQTEELLRLLPAFGSAGIRALPYKGIVLATSIYGDMALRQTWDIDLLVEDFRIVDARKLLVAEGYLPSKEYDRAADFVHPEKQIEIDLHWGLTPFYFPVALDFETLWAHREKTPLAGQEVSSFGAEDLLLILCLQVAKDCWERRQHLEYLSKVVDIAEVLRARPGLDWAEIATRAARLGLRRVLHFGVLLAAGLLDAELPEEIRYQADADAGASRLAHQVCRQLFGDKDRAVAKPEASVLNFSFRVRQLKFYLSMRERPRDWLSHFYEIGRMGIPRAWHGSLGQSAP